MPRKAKPVEADPVPSKKTAVAAKAPETEIALPATNGDKDNLPGNVNDKIRQLIRQAKEQGYLTFDDINETIPEAVDNPEEIETVEKWCAGLTGSLSAFRIERMNRSRPPYLAVVVKEDA